MRVVSRKLHGEQRFCFSSVSSEHAKAENDRLNKDSTNEWTGSRHSVKKVMRNDKNKNKTRNLRH